MLKKRVSIFLLSCLCFMLVLHCDVQAQKESELIELKLEARGISLIHTNRFFYAPYIVKTGETFQSISEKFYGSRDQANLLAQVAGTTADSIPTPGSNVYIVTGQIFLNFSSAKKEGQAQTVQRFLRTLKKGTLFEYKWSKADVSVEYTPEGKQVMNKFNAAEIHLYASGAEKPRLVLVFAQKPVLELFEGKTQLTDVSIEK
jgi:hypothetical protein